MDIYTVGEILYENEEFIDRDRTVLAKVHRPEVKFRWPFSRRGGEGESGRREGMAIVTAEDAPLFWMTPLEPNDTKSIPDLWADDPSGARIGVLRRRFTRLGPIKVPGDPLGGSFDAEDASGTPIGAVRGERVDGHFSVDDPAGSRVASIASLDDTWEINISASVERPLRCLILALVVAAEEVLTREIAI